jgi:DNA-binding SARP family transcriptional activator/TolB-like protein
VLGPVRGSVHSSPPELTIQLLGPLRVLRADVAVPLPASRKLRALVAYLAMSTRPQSREHLCELLWPLPDDPRAQLRICLSSARKVLDAPERARVVGDDAGMRLDLQGVDVDALQVDAAVQAGLEWQTLEQLQTLVAPITGEFLEGLEIDHCPAFTGWLVAQRRRFRAAHLALLEALALRLPADAAETLDVLGRWLQLAPFDRRAHTTLLSALALREAWHEGEAHLSAAVRSFEAERLDPGCLVDAWRRVRQPAKPAVWLDAVPATLPANLATAVPRRAAIAVMPFEEPSAQGPGRVANALVHDVITGLAKLRTLFVIARGTVFSLAQRHIGPEEAARLLNVDYFVAGQVHRRAGRLRVSVELVETHTARVVWTEVFDQPVDKTFAASASWP